MCTVFSFKNTIPRVRVFFAERRSLMQTMEDACSKRWDPSVTRTPPANAFDNWKRFPPRYPWSAHYKNSNYPCPVMQHQHNYWVHHVDGHVPAIVTATSHSPGLSHFFCLPTCLLVHSCFNFCLFSCYSNVQSYFCKNAKIQCNREGLATDQARAENVRQV